MLLDDVPGALWTIETLMGCHVDNAKVPDLQRIVVAVDPSGSDGDDKGDAQGIVIAGMGVDGRGYVLGDWTCKMSPAGWGRRVIDAFDHFGADRVVAEKNFGGEMVRATIQMARKECPVELVTASRGKILRAEPISALYEQGRISHVVPPPEPGYAPDNPFAELEEEMRHATTTGYLGENSPNRMDALVWAFTELFLTPNADGWIAWMKERSEAAKGKK